MIPYSKQDINQSDIDAVVEVLNSDFLTQGPKVTEFEIALCKYTNSKFSIATNSATSALHIACLSLGLSEGDWLWTSANTFAASANCALYCGASIDFVDINPQTYNLCPAKLEKKLIQAKKANNLPKVVIPVHFAGQPCNMKAIHQLSLEYGFKIIEDASHAIGGSYQNKLIGSCEYSDITIFSFHPVKIMTTAEGGIATTNQKKLAETMQLLRSHGITRDPHLMQEPPDGPWSNQQITLGFNYRMSDIHAALGLSQLLRLDEFVTKRHELASRYFDELSNLPLTLPYQEKESLSSFHLFPVCIKLEELKVSRKQIYADLHEQGIGVNIHYQPVYLHPYYRNKGFNEGLCPVAEDYYSRTLSLPLFSKMSLEQQDTVIYTIKRILGAYA